ncbi:oxidoreductase [Prauserella cavernicola]|uniref:NAD-binding protein n=1 Tax=Prauserella cavernicola TaxID=2800127 RepID=A0A934R014_9PSEU|nr:NAD-binding protein [Prauserella cavernicola]MBK1789197.1 NAD-binding protein [Prauserella cavernicola]
MTGTAYPHVFRPTEIGGVPLRNRVFVSAHTTNFGEHFLPTERHVAYHAERARGGVGLIVTEPLRVHRTSLGRAGGLGTSRDSLPMLERLVTAVRDAGSAIFTQLTHAGRHSENVFERTASWGPTNRRFHAAGAVPHAVNRREMSEVRNAYVDGARLAADAGFQGIEIHFGHGHLLHQFISPLSNDRCDAYGGSEENRLRFPLEVLDSVLDAVGDRVAVGVRMSADELVEGGQDLAAGTRLARLLDTTRPIAFLNVSVASYTVPSIGHHVADMNEGHAPYLPLAYAIADACDSVPVLTACRFVDLADADHALADGRLTAIAMTRAHLADPHLVRKALAGREHDIRPCVAHNFCIGEVAGHRAITCMMNPTVGREAEWPVEPPAAEVPRRVVVVGAGPAGLEAARVAAERGHDVQLWERSGELGGRLGTARRGSGRGELDRLRRYAEHRLTELGVDVRTGRVVGAATVLAERPDAVVVATGALDRPSAVAGWGRTLTAAEALDGRTWTGRTLVVLDDDGSWTAASVAETAARGGAEVHVVAAAGTPLWDIGWYSRMTIVERLRSLGVRLWTSATAGFAHGGATVTSGLTGQATTVDGVTDVVALAIPETEHVLAEHLDGTVPTVHVIGDAVAPRSLLEAMFEGHAIGRAL